MDAKCILDSFVVSAKQYISSPIEPNLVNLKRHLDIVAGLTNSNPYHPALDPQNLVAVECYSSLVNIILDNLDQAAVVRQVIKIFTNLGLNRNLLKTLQCKFQLSTAVSLFIRNHGFNSSDPIVIECLKLLELATDRIVLPYMEGYMQDLITFLIAEIDSLNVTICNTALHILANLCHENVCVQVFVGNLPNSKQIYKSLTSKLCSPTYISIIYSLSILASVTLRNNKLGKVFTHKHACEAFELIVLILPTDDEVSSEAALSLFLDFYEIPLIFDSFLKYGRLEKGMRKLADACGENTPLHQIARCFRFFLCFTDSPCAKKPLLNILCPPSVENGTGRKIHESLMRVIKDGGSSPGDSLLYCLKLMIYLVNSLENFECRNSQASFRNFLGECSKILQMDIDYSSSSVQRQLEIQTGIFDFMFALCEKISVHEYIASTIDLKICHKIVFLQFDKNPMSYEDDDWSESGVNLLMAILRLVGCLEEFHDFAEFLSLCCETNRFLPFLAYALSSSSKEAVGRSLYIISKKYSDIPSALLEESISRANHNRLKQSSGNEDLSGIQSPIMLSKTHDEGYERNVETLINRINSGLNVNELKISEILSVYETKINCLLKREDDLHSLILAKSTALHQAEKIISQYKCRQTQRDAESTKLRALLRESEKRSEKSGELFDQMTKDYKDLEVQIKVLRGENSSLLMQIQEHKETINELNEKMSQELASFEEDKKAFQKHLKEKEYKIIEYAKEVNKYEDLLKKKQENFQILESEKLKYKVLCEQREKAYLKLEQEHKMLELVCQQREKSIAEKEATIKSLNVELEEHRAITSMIRDISNRRVTSLSTSVDNTK